MTITENKFREIIAPLIGLPISRIWRGFGSALFLELGKLSKKSYRLKNGKRKDYFVGQFTVFIGWEWRVERLQSIYY